MTVMEMSASKTVKPNALLLAQPKKTPNPPPMKPTPRTRGRKQERPRDQGDNLGGRSHAASRSPSRVEASTGAPDDGDESDTGLANLWNPHTSLKPSELDEEALDGEVGLEGDLPYGTTIKVNDLMMEMMIDLEDARDLDWLPLEERMRLKNRQKGD